jgi:hypothetical protein
LRRFYARLEAGMGATAVRLAAAMLSLPPAQQQQPRRAPLIGDAHSPRPIVAAGERPRAAAGAKSARAAMVAALWSAPARQCAMPARYDAAAAPAEFGDMWLISRPARVPLQTAKAA